MASGTHEGDGDEMTSIVEKRSIRSSLGERTADTQVAAPRDPQIVWTQMGEGIWVAKRDHDFAGLIEELWGAGYRVTDRTGAIIGEFATLQSARRQLQ